MKLALPVFVLALCLAWPARAEFRIGDIAPDFVAGASLGGKEFKFRLHDALQHGPVVVYFFPSAYTTGCDVEAHAFAEAKSKFEIAGTGIIGVSADNLARLNRFAADPDFCAGKFPIASDESLAIAKSYGLQTSAGITRDEKGTLTGSDVNVGAKDLRGEEMNHGFIERATFVIGRDHRIVSITTTRQDKITASQHVERALAVAEHLTTQPAGKVDSRPSAGQ